MQKLVSFMIFLHFTCIYKILQGQLQYLDWTAHSLFSHHVQHISVTIKLARKIFLLGSLINTSQKIVQKDGIWKDKFRAVISRIFRCSWLRIPICIRFPWYARQCPCYVFLLSFLAMLIHNWCSHDRIRINFVIQGWRVRFWQELRNFISN